MKQLFFSILIVALVITSCKKDSDSAIPVTSSGLMVFDAVPGNVKFDVVLDTISVFNDLGYGEHTGYKQFRARKYTLMIFQAGNRTTPLAGGEINLRNNRFYSAFLGVDVNNALVLMATEDVLDGPKTAGNAQLRVVDLSDTRYGTNSTRIQLDYYTDTTKIFSRVSFGNITPFQEIKGDSLYKLDARWADSSLSILKKDKVPFSAKANGIYTIVTSGNALDPNDIKLFEVINK
jgi:hypothetical protein